MTVRDFVSGLALVVVVTVATMWLHAPNPGIGPGDQVRDHASIPPTGVHPIFEFARTWKDKKPAQAGINCFGTTLAAFGLAGAPRYASDTELSAFLSRSCEMLGERDPVTRYDVGVIFDGRTGQRDAAHSFIIVSRGIVFYKDGVEKSGNFVAGNVVPMLREFRVGFSEEKCADVDAKATVESGLPCPGVVKRFRCKNVKPIDWPALDALEMYLFALVADRTAITDAEKNEVVTRLATLTSASSMASISRVDPVDRNLLIERLGSLETFFTFYADRKIWGEGNVVSMRGLARATKLAIMK